MNPRIFRIPLLSTGTLCVFALAGALTGGLVASLAQAGDDACSAKSFKIKDVERACKTGGRKAAKKMMQAAVKKAKAAGEKVNCKSCHKDIKATFELKANAVKELKRWL